MDHDMVLRQQLKTIREEYSDLDDETFLASFFWKEYNTVWKAVWKEYNTIWSRAYRAGITAIKDLADDELTGLSTDDNNSINKISQGNLLFYKMQHQLKDFKIDIEKAKENFLDIPERRAYITKREEMIKLLEDMLS